MWKLNHACWKAAAVLATMFLFFYVIHAVIILSFFFSLETHFIVILFSFRENEDVDTPNKDETLDQMKVVFNCQLYYYILTSVNYSVSLFKQLLFL